MPHDSHQMMYVEKQPWHGLGTSLPTNGSYEEFVHAAGFKAVEGGHHRHRDAESLLPPEARALLNRGAGLPGGTA